MWKYQVIDNIIETLSKTVEYLSEHKAPVHLVGFLQLYKVI